jgi:uncharacterized cupin superfamily protein
VSEASSTAPGAPFALAAAELALEPGTLSAEQILEGIPRIAERTVWTSPDGRVETGVWEITPGVCTDVEADEVFLVISGHARVEVADGPTLELGPGVLGAFSAGARTIWRVTETLRKLYTVTRG